MSTHLHSASIATAPAFTLNLLRWSQRTAALVTAAAGTYALFRPVNSVLSAVAGLSRTVYAVWLTVALSQLVLAFGNLDAPEAALANIETFSSIWNAALGLFGVHLLMIAYLSIRSGFMPKIFGILIGLVVAPGFTPTFGLFGFIGETAMISWLLIGGWRLPRV